LRIGRKKRRSIARDERSALLVELDEPLVEKFAGERLSDGLGGERLVRANA
jgi:hypothetical protein